MKYNRTLLLLLGIILGGCAQSTAPSSQVVLPNAWKDSSIGAEFATEGTYEDSSQYGITNGPFQALYQVADSNLIIGGKTHVNELIFDGGEIIYATYEQNGDFSIGDSTYNGLTNELQWTTYPIASGGTLSDPTVDSLTDGGFGDTIRSSSSRTFVDRETITIGGTPFQAIKIAANYQNSESGSGYPSEDIQNSFLWFIPQIGFFGKETDDDVSINTVYNNGYYVPSIDHYRSQSELSMYANRAAPPAPAGKSATPQSISSNGSSRLLNVLLPQRFTKVR